MSGPFLCFATAFAQANSDALTKVEVERWQPLPVYRFRFSTRPFSG